jgi:predicted ATP-dependent protease
LMLNDEVIAAVGNGSFHVWAVSSVDEGIEILTGVEAGERQQDGTWPEGSVNARVDKRLRELAEVVRRFSAGKKEEGEEQQEI